MAVKHQEASHDILSLSVLIYDFPLSYGTYAPQRLKYIYFEY